MPAGKGRARRGASGPSPPRARGRTAPTGRASRARRAHRCRSPSSGQPGPPRLGRAPAPRGPGRPATGPTPRRLGVGSPRVACRRHRGATGARGTPCHAGAPTRVPPQDWWGNGGRQHQGQRPAGVEQSSGATPAQHARAGATWWPPGSRAGPVRRVSRPHHGGTGHTSPRQALEASPRPAGPGSAGPGADRSPPGGAPRLGPRLARAPAAASAPGQRVWSRRGSAQGRVAGASRAGGDRRAPDGFLAHRRREQALRRPGRTAGGLDQPGLAPPAPGVPQGGLASPGRGPGRCRAWHASAGEPAHGATAVSGRKAPGAGWPRLCSARAGPGQAARRRGLPGARPAARPGGARWRTPSRGARRSRTAWTAAGPPRQEHGTRCGPPAQTNVPACVATLRPLVQPPTHAPAGHRRRPRHPGLRGGAPSPPHGASPRTGATVEQHRVPRLGQGAPRRHPHTARGGSKAQDVRSEPGHPWGCFGPVRRPPGRGPDGRRCRASQGPRRRPTHRPGAAPPEASSLAARAGVRRARPLPGRRHVGRRWKAPEGLWGVCQQRLTALTGWQSQPRVWRPHGGAARADHRGLRHPHGQAQGHNQRLEGVKPRPHRGVSKA